MRALAAPCVPGPPRSGLHPPTERAGREFGPSPRAAEPKSRPAQGNLPVEVIFLFQKVGKRYGSRPDAMALAARSLVSPPVDSSPIDPRDRTRNLTLGAKVIDGLSAPGDGTIVIHDDIAAWRELGIQVF